MKTITITQKDLSTHDIAFTLSGSVIDELAYSVGEYTQDDIYTNGDGEPYKPYSFDYEGDLFVHTRNEDALYSLAKTLEISLNANVGKRSIEASMQAGAWLALNDDITWSNFLEAYTKSLNEARTESMSDEYNKALEKKVNDYYDDMIKEWLHGDHSNWFGVIYQIGQYYSENPRECSYDSKLDEYTFSFDEDFMRDELEAYDGSAFSLEAYKDYLLYTIRNKSEARKAKEEKESADRKIERERLAKYKAEQKAKADAERVAKLSKLTL